jgi:hypothetical protein
LLEPAARALGVGRGNLHQMLKRYARLEAVRQEQRQVMGDFESKTFESMSEKHWPSIQYYLSTQCKDRGYVLPKGTALNTGEHDGDPERADQAIRAGNSLTMTSS